MANTLFLGGIPLVAGKPPSYISLLVLHSSRQAYLQTSKQKGQFLPVLLLQLFREHHPTTCLSFHFHIPASVLQRVQPSHQASFFFPHSLPVTVSFTPTFAPTRLPSNSPVTTSSPALTVRTLYRDQRVRSSNPFTSIFFPSPQHHHLEPFLLFPDPHQFVHPRQILPQCFHPSSPFMACPPLLYTHLPLSTLIHHSQLTVSMATELHSKCPTREMIITPRR
ncbi:hypothetical protein VUR80DRAFT_3314 [Thermomyces stellatus]